MWSLLFVGFCAWFAAVKAKDDRHFALYEWDTGIITAESGCVEHRTMLPERFYSLRVDSRDYTPKGKKCVADVDPSDTLKCSVKNVGKKMFLTKVTICKPQEHIWLGFKLRKFFKHDRYGYVTNFFYPGGKWASADKYCIQPDLSSPLRIFAKGKDKVEVTCFTRKSSCSASPWVVMFTPDRELCRNFSTPHCEKREQGDEVSYSHTLHRPNRRRQFDYVFCSTANSYLSTVIAWDEEHYTEVDDDGDKDDGIDDNDDKDDDEDDDDDKDDDKDDHEEEDDDDHKYCRDSKDEISEHDLEKMIFGSKDDGADLMDMEETDKE